MHDPASTDGNELPTFRLRCLQFHGTAHEYEVSRMNIFKLQLWISDSCVVKGIAGMEQAEKGLDE